MIAESYNVVGVMSGTSLDGCDLAYINLSVNDGKWQYKIFEAETIPYTKEWLHKLRTAIDYSQRELEALNVEYTILLSEIIRDFIARHRLINMDAICSHGHTIVHRPQDGITLQIGNLPAIATLTGQRVVCDFRVADVVLGGQGAPLVPIGDRLLFSEYNFCLNLGGFSNISFEENGNRIAYDICPVNTVLNFYANQLGYEYDDGGKIAAAAVINDDLLRDLNSLDYYTAPYPKSLGLEFVKQTVLPLVDKYKDTAPNNLATFTEHIAVQISNALLNKSSTGSLLITGGGAYNNLLVNRMRELMPELDIVVPDDKTVQYKEALIFALLGVLKLREEINVLASVTGAPYDHTSGIIY
jgi:anhydro-N-acetylmuramic acid kinase